VVTGVSGSGKSSLAFDTVYSEGQRRYVETFSPYARQFLDRMDKPQVDRIEGIPPAIAIDQTNPVRTSRSTVGTMTELNDHVKLLYARAALLYCSNCGREVRRDDAESIYAQLLAEPKVGAAATRVLVTFTVPIPESFSGDEIEKFLAGQGYTRIRARTAQAVEVVQDRLKFEPENRARLAEALEAALKIGNGHVTVRLAEDEATAFKFSAHRHCAHCDLAYDDCIPNTFSFNSPVGACEQFLSRASANRCTNCLYSFVSIPDSRVVRIVGKSPAIIAGACSHRPGNCRIRITPSASALSSSLIDRLNQRITWACRSSTRYSRTP
jgi:excinuclease ABC subunit A